jgi:hypothetical protein
LAEFLEISMDELLTLYGATCVAAMRPSLERLLSDREGKHKETVDTDVSPSSAEAPDVPSNDHLNESDDTSNEVVLELREATNQPEYQESERSYESTNSESDDMSNEVELELREVTDTPDEEKSNEPSYDHLNESDDTSNEVVLELREATNHLDPEDQEPPPLPDLEGGGDSEESSSRSQPQEDVIAWLDPPSRPEDLPTAESVIFESTPFFIREPLAENDKKSSELKKKKKKKKKKKS